MTTKPEKPKFITSFELHESDGVNGSNELLLKVAQESELMYKRVMMQREKILEAFIAETGLRPSECVQVIENTLTKTEWYVKPKNQGE